MISPHRAASDGPAEDDDPAASLKALYLEGARQDVSDLEELLRRVEGDPGVWPDCQTRMREIAHNVKGQGTSFGYPLMTRVGQSLSALLKSFPDRDAAARKLLAAHVAALRTVLDKDIMGNGGEVGEALAGRLEALVTKVA